MDILRAINALLVVGLALLLGACSGNPSQTQSSPAASQSESSIIDKNAAAFANLEADSAPLTANFNTIQCMDEGFDLIRCDLEVIRLTPTEGRISNEVVSASKEQPLNLYKAAVQCTYTLDGDSYDFVAGTLTVTFEGPWGEAITDLYVTLNNGLTGNGDRLCPGSLAP